MAATYLTDGSSARYLDARYHISAMVFFNESETVAGMTSDTMVLNARLDVGIRSISEGATQQQSGGVVFAAGASARPVFETRIELHQHEHLVNRKRETMLECVSACSFIDRLSSIQKEHLYIKLILRCTIIRRGCLNT